MRKHDLTNKKTTTKTNTKTKTMKMTNTFREHLQRAILETCNLWDIWSEWWGNMTWPTKRQQRRQTQWQWQKFRVWPLIHCYESDSSRPNWWGLTKFHNFRQISQFWPNFTILVGLSHEEERRWSPDDVKRHSRGDPNNKPEVVLVPRRPRQHRCKHKFTSCIAVNWELLHFPKETQISKPK